MSKRSKPQPKVEEFTSEDFDAYVYGKTNALRERIIKDKLKGVKLETIVMRLLVEWSSDRVRI